MTKPARLISYSALVLIPLLSRADSVTFAQFVESGRGGNEFSFTNFGSSAVLQTKAALGSNSIPVTFSFLSFAQSDLPTDLQGPQAAHMTLYIKTTAEATLAGGYFAQSFYSTAASGVPQYGSLVITRDTPDRELHETNLLTVTFDAVSGGLDGIRLGQTAGLSADNAAGDYVQFSSSYLSFQDGADENLALSFSSASPCFTLYTQVKTMKGGCMSSGNAMLNFLHSFSAAGTGTFASNPDPATVFVTPEPDTIQLVFGGLLVYVALLRAKKHPGAQPSR